MPGLSDVEYLAQSMYEPTAFVVPGFPPAMPPVNQPPIGLTDQEILCVIAALQTLGGTATVTLKTTHTAITTARRSRPQAPRRPGRSLQQRPRAAEPPSSKKGAQLRPAVSTPAALAKAEVRQGAGGVTR